MSLLALQLFLYLFAVSGIVLTAFGLPGTWFALAAAGIYAIATDFNPPGQDVRVIALLLFITLLGEAVEFVVSIAGAKRLNVGNATIVASIVGGLVGAVIGVPVFIVGSLLGLLIGAFLGALVYELLVKTPTDLALRKAISIVLSRMVSILFKTGVAIVMAVFLVWKTL